MDVAVAVKLVAVTGMLHVVVGVSVVVYTHAGEGNGNAARRLWQWHVDAALPKLTWQLTRRAPSGGMALPPSATPCQKLPTGTSGVGVVVFVVTVLTVVVVLV